ncbi:MAG: helix-turn-helix domain-containing protein [Pseudomonadota bacterium]|nr:helix-turn-helix domain-containing protein [Pseudomonadota bacterium]
MIEQFNYLVRVMALGSGVMLIALIMANQVRAQLKVPLVGMLVGVVCYLINSTPLTAPSSVFDPWIDLISLSTTPFIWLFARNLFERPPDRRVLLGAIALFLAGWFSSNFLPVTRPAGFFAVHVISLVMIADLIRVGLLERGDDLVEQRRTIRLWLPLLVAAQAASILLYEIAEMLFEIDSRSPGVALFNSLIILLLMLFAGIALLRTDAELLVATQQEEETEDETAALDLSPAEAVLHEKLTEFMAGGAYREPGLTIAGLAAQLGTPEHRLRALINQRLGYRNFSAFLNRHRIAEARIRLADKDMVDLPVLTIAMDLGYNSLATFNRAFRAETTITPSEFRRLNLTQGSDQN